MPTGDSDAAVSRAGEVGISWRFGDACSLRTYWACPSPSSASLLMVIGAAVDVDELEQMLAELDSIDDPKAQRPTLERAVRLFRGEPLAGWNQEWTEGDVGRLRSAHIELLERAGHARLVTGDAHGASRQPGRDSHSTATTRASGASLCRRTVASASSTPSAGATSSCAACSESSSAWNQRAPHARSTTSCSGSGRSRVCETIKRGTQVSNLTAGCRQATRPKQPAKGNRRLREAGRDRTRSGPSRLRRPTCLRALASSNTTRRSSNDGELAGGRSWTRVCG